MCVITKRNLPRIETSVDKAQFVLYFFRNLFPTTQNYILLLFLPDIWYIKYVWRLFYPAVRHEWHELAAENIFSALEFVRLKKALANYFGRARLDVCDSKLMYNRSIDGWKQWIFCWFTMLCTWFKFRRLGQVLYDILITLETSRKFFYRIMTFIFYK